jgi:hypothetical protein
MDKENGNNLWQESIDKELKMINQFQIFWWLDKGKQLSSDFKPVPYFIVFANKFDGQWKAWLVANGNKTFINNEDVYSGVVGMETVCLGFLLAKMNCLKVWAADISSAFLYSKLGNADISSPDPNLVYLRGKIGHW